MKPFKCRRVHRHLVECAEGTLPANLRTLVNEHLAGCPDCRARLEFLQKSVDALRRAPVLEVPAYLWHQIAAQTIHQPAQPEHRPAPWIEWVFNLLEEITWGRKVAFSSALTAALVFLVLWGTFWPSQHQTLPVVELAAQPAGMLPSYFREYHNPANQPISDGAMVLAYNTMGEKP